MHTTMIHNQMFRFAAIVLVLLGLVQVSTAQTLYKVGGQPVITLYGTSTLHNWTMTAHAFTCNAQLGLSADNQLASITGLVMSLPVQNLKSEHDGMNDNAYETLNADKYKDIVFKLTSAKITGAGGNKFQVVALGSLTIAGTTRPVTLTAAAQVNSDGSVGCSGSVPIKFSEFNIKRPSFMLGTMSVGDALTLNYALVFVK